MVCRERSGKLSSFISKIILKNTHYAQHQSLFHKFVKLCIDEFVRLKICTPFTFVLQALQIKINTLQQKKLFFFLFWQTLLRNEKHFKWFSLTKETSPLILVSRVDNQHKQEMIENEIKTQLFVVAVFFKTTKYDCFTVSLIQYLPIFL